MTNIGAFGVDGGTPILNPGDAAVRCVGQITARPWESHGEIKLQKLCTLSLSFDHRLVDGQLGSQVPVLPGYLPTQSLAFAQ
jgi:pyruvate dehydrogenase E2 component (dihydrolipoamide acetyltransferase)